MSESVKRVLKREQVLVRHLSPAGNQAAGSYGHIDTKGRQADSEPALEAQVEMVPEPSADPQVDLDAERRRAWEEGFRQGYQQAQDDLRPLVNSLKEAATRVAEERDELIRGAELAVVRLAYEVAKKIVGHEVQMSSDAVLYIVREALRRIADRDRIVIRLNPQEVQTVRNNADLRRDLLETFSKVEVREDAEISRGGCVVETSSGLIDATIETQLAEIEAALFGED